MALIDNLEKLRLYYAVIQSGSIRKAAKTLRMTQPALSRSMAALESALEIRLFSRGREGILMTAEGQELFQFAERLLKDVEKVQTVLQHGQDALDFEITIGTYDSIAVYFLPKFLKHLNLSQQNVSLHIKTASSAQLMTDLKSGLLDLVISVNPPAHSRVKNLILFEDSYSFYQSPRLPEAKKHKYISVFRARDLNGKSVADHLKSLQAKQVIDCESFETAKTLTVSALGIGILPTKVAEDSVKSGDLVAAKAPASGLSYFGPHSIALSYLKVQDGGRALTWIEKEIVRFLTPKK